MASKYAQPVRVNRPSGRTFDKRFIDALQQRAYPNTGLHLKQLAHLAGCSADTFLRWWRGESRIPAEAVANIIHFFAGRGDRSFLAELYPDAVPAASLNAELSDLKARFAQLERRIEGHAGSADLRDVASAPATAAHPKADRQGGVVVSAGRALEG